MTAAPDLITKYLDDLGAGLRVPVAEAELILAEAEDHLRETAAAGRETGMTEAAAQQSAISSFGPVGAVVRAHHRRAITPGGAAMAAWKLTGLVATTLGAGGVAGMELYQFVARTAPLGWGGPNPLVFVYAALAAGGLVLLAARRLARRGAPGRDLLSPGVMAGCFLLASAVLGWYWLSVRANPPAPPQPPPDLPCPWSCSWSPGPPPPDSGPAPALMVLIVYAAMAACVLVVLAARRLARRRATDRGPLSPTVAASCFLLASAPLLALIVLRAHFLKGQAVPLAPVIGETWLTPVSQGSISAAPCVSGAVVVGCLALAVGFGIQAAVRHARCGPARRRAWPGAGPARSVLRVLGQAGRGGVGRAYV